MHESNFVVRLIMNQLPKEPFFLPVWKHAWEVVLEEIQENQEPT